LLKTGTPHIIFFPIDWFFNEFVNNLPIVMQF
jgi:hypothetical protein